MNVVCEAKVPVCLMHMQGKPATMQGNPCYTDVSENVCEFLAQRIRICIVNGIPKSHIIVDPGFGFGKTDAHNLQLMKKLTSMGRLACPILISASRKSTLGHVLRQTVEHRLAGSLALASWAVANGARLIRAHDVAETVDALAMTWAIMQQATASTAVLS